MKRRSNLLLYLFLNIIVSAGTTLAVLFLWDTVRKAEIPPPPPGMVPEQGAVGGAAIVQSPEEAGVALPTATLPPADRVVIEIASVIGVGDLNQEFVLLRRVGEGNLVMTGWQLVGERGSAFTFAPQPELTLYKDGAVVVYSKAGDNTATEVFWNRSNPAWESGELLRLLDSAGNERATYVVP